jgi:hypothetical protein
MGSLDPARYEELIECLSDLQQRASSLDPLRASLEALCAVIFFWVATIASFLIPGCYGRSAASC